MKLYEALTKVSAITVPGVVAYYAKQNPDLWQAAFDELDQISNTFDPLIVEPVTNRFVNRCIELIDRFKREGEFSISVSPADGFAMGSEKRLEQQASIKQKRCLHCGSANDLTLQRIEKKSFDLQIVCMDCKDQNAMKKAR